MSITGEFQYNSVLVYGDDILKLTQRGFGARRFNTVPRKKNTTFQVSGNDFIITKKTLTEIMAIQVQPNLLNQMGESTPTTESDVPHASSQVVDSAAVVETTLEESDSSDDEDDDEEPLLLSDEEAFFLRSQGHMVVIDSSESENDEQTPTMITSEALWTIFLTKCKDFPIRYKTYDFFKSQGYVVKGGINYGVDFSCYRSTPLWCHSEYCAIVIDGTTNAPSDTSLDAETLPCQLGWRNLSAITRVMPDVMKMPLLCYVVPKSIGATFVSQPTLFGVRKRLLAESMIQEQQQEQQLDNELETKDVFAKTSLEADSSVTNILLASRQQISIDFTSMACLDDLVVCPIVTVNRRHHILNEKYQTVETMHDKFNSASILKRPRVEVAIIKKKTRVRRSSANDVREKKKSKGNKVWQNLLKPVKYAADHVPGVIESQQQYFIEATKEDNSSSSNSNSNNNSNNSADIPRGGSKKRKLHAVAAQTGGGEEAKKEKGKEKKGMSVEERKLAIIAQARAAVAAANEAAALTQKQLQLQLISPAVDN